MDGYGPGRLDVSHGPDEYVEEAALRRAAAEYALYAGEVRTLVLRLAIAVAGSSSPSRRATERTT
jgi:hypothetical protein